MSFFTDAFMDDFDKGTLDDARILASKWSELFDRKELWQNAKFFTSEELKKLEKKEEKGSEETEYKEMSDEDLKIATLHVMKKDFLGIVGAMKGKTCSLFKSGNAVLNISGCEEDELKFIYKKDNAELDFYFNGDGMDLDELDDYEYDDYDTGVYIFQKITMALKIDRKTEIEFSRIRKKDRHAIRSNDVTLTEFLNYFAPYYGFCDWPEGMAEKALHFKRHFDRIMEKKVLEEADAEAAAREKAGREEVAKKQKLVEGI